jgi:hypothetical protein
LNDAALMIMYGFTNLCYKLQPLARAQLVLFRILVERFAAYEFHREVGLRPASAIGRTSFMNLGNAGRLSPPEYLRLQPETSQQLRNR